MNGTPVKPRMLIIFDLDGTLIDSAEDLAIATNQTRAHFGREPLDAKLIHSYVGNGAATLVRRAMGPDASDTLVDEALSFFVKYYRKHALAHTRLYPGVESTVSALSAQGHTLAILTNKPVRISTDIVTGLRLGTLFTRVYGGDSFEQKKPDPIGINTLLAETNSQVPDAWMVGDSSVDIQTARNAKVRACGVSWGFQPESFAKHPPDVVVDKPEQLLSALDRNP
jgi:phosphoglycolate phosphatase